MGHRRRHVLVTGASSGIGRATAVSLAGAGCHVYAGVRKVADGESLRAEVGRQPGSGELSPLLLDVTDGDQIAAAYRTVTDHVGDAGLDGLVDNAGIGIAWPVELIPLAELRWQFEVNVIGQVAVTQAFLPLLRQARGRIIVIGSVGDRFTLPFGGPLSASKHAVASLAGALRQELTPWGIRVVLIEPASIRTDAVDKLEREAHRAADAFPPAGRALYRDSFLGMIRIAVRLERRGSPPQVVADVVAKALSARRPRARYLVGKNSRRLATLAGVLPVPVLDALFRRIFHLPAQAGRVA